MIDPMPGDIFQTGQVLNNTYEILGILGRGGTGEVYLARNQVVDRKVAIKALNSQFSGNTDYVELMKREEEMRDIIHDAVVRYSECSRSDQDHVFLVMEFVDGVSLNDVMMDRRVEDKELLIIAHRVLEGLVLVHQHGIVHRDLSPDNIILRDGSAERATIIDFGIAKDTAAGARTIVGNDFAGKYEYAAPEQLEGNVEYRTDLYALGASLLAAKRREIPFPGATPGEIIRRKQDALDTSGINAPLKDLIDTLTAPDIAARPADAAAALAQVSGYLKGPDRGRTRSKERRPNRDRSAKTKTSGGGKLLLMALPVLAIVAVGGAWIAGIFDGEPPLPVARPYQLTASLSDTGISALKTHAPTLEVGNGITQAFISAAGAPASPPEISLADGMPVPEWPAYSAQALELASGLEHWDLTVSDTNMTVTGLAADLSTRDKLRKTFDQWAASSGFTVNRSLTAGPADLPVASVQSTLDRYGTCGPLSQGREAGTSYALFETITVNGQLANAADQETLKQTLTPLIGDRTLRLDTTVLNDDLCAIRDILPPTPPNNLSIWLGDGSSDQATLTGIFTTGQNPVVEVHMPEAIGQGYLWVMVIDNTGKVFHILPNVNHPEYEIGGLGTVENGLRQVRVLHSVDEFKADNSLLAMTVNEGDYGKSEVIAILTRDELFDLRRPRDESVTSVVEALAEALTGREENIIGVASRLIDARP